MIFKARVGRIRHRLIAAGLFLVLAFCAAAPQAMAEEGEIYDPWEPFNRGVFAFNQALDSAIFKPIAKIYVAVVPDLGRRAISNVLNNLKSPVTLANDLLQGDMERAQATIARFVVNTTVGFGGINDAAADMGLPIHHEDFGQTAAVHGVSSGPYLMLPFFGPSTLRDGIGTVIDGVIDPVGGALNRGENIARFVTDGVDRRATFLDASEALESTSLDYYASIRSVFLQNRNYEIRNGVPEPIKDIYSEAPAPAETTAQKADTQADFVAAGDPCYDELAFAGAAQCGDF